MQVQRESIILIIAVITGIFLLAALFMFFYITVFNERKKRHMEEKQTMKILFDQELVRTEFEVQEQTRKNLASDLHDNIGQLLSLTSVLLGSVNIGDTQKAEQKISDAHELVLRSVKELRQLSRLIHGEQILQLGLLEGIRQEINWLERSGHYIVEFSEPDTEPETINAEKDLFAYRVLQEALSNIIKHAQADRIKIGLKFEAGKLTMTISDNGLGFEARLNEQGAAGLGIRNMQRRVSMVKGLFDIQSGRGVGTGINISIPYP